MPCQSYLVANSVTLCKLLSDSKRWMHSKNEQNGSVCHPFNLLFLVECDAHTKQIIHLWFVLSEN